MIKPKLISNEIYHIYNRGVEKREIFLNDKEKFRFIHDLFEFNDKESAQNVNYYLNKTRSIEVQPRYVHRERALLVEILAFCLMPNHYHLLVAQKVDNGIVNFMQKLGTGYTMYFNKKHERVGPLFQGRFKAVHVGADNYFRHLCHYIHLNPLDLAMPEWREGKIKNFNSTMDYLKKYRWSSFIDYSGGKNFPSVISKKLISEVFENKYTSDLKSWIKDMNLESVKDLLLE